MGVERSEYTFLWFIENYTYCWHKNEVKLVSPNFTPEGLESTAWSLRLYPRGEDDEDHGFISLFLNRNNNDAGPDTIFLRYELSILAVDASAVVSRETEDEFDAGRAFGWGQMMKVENILQQREQYLPRDTLCVRCRMWKGEGAAELATQISARTLIGIEQISFLHKVEGFSALKPSQKKIVEIPSLSEKKCVASSSLFIADDPLCKSKIMIEITAISPVKILSKCKLYLLDRSGNMIECGEADYRFGVERNGTETMSHSLTRELILNNKTEYLPDDQLSVLCECSFSSGEEFKKIERILHDIPVTALKQIKATDFGAGMRAPSLCPGALEDFKDLYLSHILADVELKTRTKSFPAHKSVLCARSPVFRAMLSHDMKEKTTGCIEVDDLEDGTVQQLLLFLYSDELEDLQWKTATRLYYAADKYEVQKLKAMCFCFLKGTLDTSNAIELLLLADAHNDSDLKKCVEDFIFKYEHQIFGSEEWEKLMDTNPLLFKTTMLLKYKRQKEVK